MNQEIRSRSVLSITLVVVGLLAAMVVVEGLGAYADTSPWMVSEESAAEDDWQGEGTQPGSWYGESVRSAGDVNCDGYDDAIVGAVNYDHSGYSDSGRAYLYYGSDVGLSETADRIIEPPKVENYGFFGGMATTAGDVNNDGCSDVMVSMVNYDDIYSDEGAVFVWYGSKNGLANNYDWMAHGNTTFAHLGWDASTAGDVNGDNYDDIIAGAIRYDGYEISHAHVWFGSASGLNGGVYGTPSSADWTATTDQHCNAAPGCSSFGSRVGTAGDVNGDEIDDLFVGAPRYDNGQTDEGVVFVWYGSKDDGPNGGVDGTPANADWKAESNMQGAMLSGDWNYHVPGADTAGDVDGDGIDDLIIGSHYYNNGTNNEGAAFVWLGSKSGLNGGVDGTPANAVWTADSNQEASFFGFAVSNAGDTNGDGYDDVLIGAWAYDVTGTTTITNGGQLMVWFGSDQGLGSDGTPANADWTAAGDQLNAYLGYSVDSLGDVNGDGGSDAIAGAPVYDVNGVPLAGDTSAVADQGAAFAFYGVAPVTGLSAYSDGPTDIGGTTTFTATITAGSSVSYTWDFGDTYTATGKVAAHIYGVSGEYTVEVTAENSFSTDTYTFKVEVLPKPVYIPILNKQ